MRFVNSQESDTLKLPNRTILTMMMNLLWNKLLAINLRLVKLNAESMTENYIHTISQQKLGVMLVKLMRISLY